jgi:hypothetical protein
VHNHHPLRTPLDRPRQRIQSARLARIVERESLRTARTLLPCDIGGGVDRLLDVGAVEVDRRLNVGVGAGVAKDVPEDRVLRERKSVSTPENTADCRAGERDDGTRYVRRRRSYTNSTPD